MSARRSFPLHLVAVPAVAIALAVALAACGGSSSSSSDTTSASTSGGGGGSGTTVSVQSIGGANVLINPAGFALYTNDQDSQMTVACTGPCTKIWVPLTVPSGTTPSSDNSSVQGKLGTVKDPDGQTQVTFGGKPLYTFVQDSPGEATGDGFTDSFNGTTFTWTEATTGGSSSGASSQGGSTTSGGGSTSSGGGGGYSY